MAEGLHLSSRHREEIEALLHKHLPGVEVWAYGSRVNGRSHDGSDLDLVLRSPQLTEIDASRLAEITEVLREATVPFLIEARDWARLPKSFHREIEREHVVLWRAAARQSGRSLGVGGERIYCRLEDCMAAIIDYRGKTPRKTSSGIPLITAKVVKGGRIKTPTEFIAIEDYDFWMRRGIPRLGDVLITTEAPLGEVAQLCQQRVALAQRLILLRGKSEVLDNRFLKFLMQSAPVQHQLHARATGTTVLGIKQKELRQIGLALPPLPEQRAIAYILGTLDDKIELNRRMNETLEAMARALFKSWFLDFDPVRAKMAGRDTGLPKRLADLFPDRMVDSELGEIPEGWEVKTLGDLLELAYGKALRADSRHDGDVPVYGSNGEVGWHNKRLVQGPGIVVGRKGNPGVITWAAIDFFPIDTTFYVVPKDSNQNLYFLFYALKGQDLPSIAADSAVPGLNRNLAYMNKQVLPVDRIVEHFNVYVDPIFDRSHCLAAESRILAFLRDALLPKLISGEIRLRDGDKQA